MYNPRGGTSQPTGLREYPSQLRAEDVSKTRIVEPTATALPRPEMPTPQQQELQNSWVSSRYENAVAVRDSAATLLVYVDALAHRLAQKKALQTQKSTSANAFEQYNAIHDSILKTTTRDSQTSTSSSPSDPAQQALAAPGSSTNQRILTHNYPAQNVQRRLDMNESQSSEHDIHAWSAQQHVLPQDNTSFAQASAAMLNHSHISSHPAAPLFVAPLQAAPVSRPSTGVGRARAPTPDTRIDGNSTALIRPTSARPLHLEPRPLGSYGTGRETVITGEAMRLGYITNGRTPTPGVPPYQGQDANAMASTEVTALGYSGVSSVSASPSDDTRPQDGSAKDVALRIVKSHYFRKWRRIVLEQKRIRAAESARRRVRLRVAFAAWREHLANMQELEAAAADYRERWDMHLAGTIVTHWRMLVREACFRRLRSARERRRLLESAFADWRYEYGLMCRARKAQAGHEQRLRASALRHWLEVTLNERARSHQMSRRRDALARCLAWQDRGRARGYLQRWRDATNLDKAKEAELEKLIGTDLQRKRDQALLRDAWTCWNQAFADIQQKKKMADEHHVKATKLVVIREWAQLWRETKFERVYYRARLFAHWLRLTRKRLAFALHVRKLRAFWAWRQTVASQIEERFEAKAVQFDRRQKLHRALQRMYRFSQGDFEIPGTSEDAETSMITTFSLKSAILRYCRQATLRRGVMALLRCREEAKQRQAYREVAEEHFNLQLANRCMLFIRKWHAMALDSQRKRAMDIMANEAVKYFERRRKAAFIVQWKQACPPRPDLRELLKRHQTLSRQRRLRATLLFWRRLAEAITSEDVERQADVESDLQPQGADVQEPNLISQWRNHSYDVQSELQSQPHIHDVSSIEDDAHVEIIAVSATQIAQIEQTSAAANAYSTVAVLPSEGEVVDVHYIERSTLEVDGQQCEETDQRGSSPARSATPTGRMTPGQRSDGESRRSQWNRPKEEICLPGEDSSEGVEVKSPDLHFDSRATPPRPQPESIPPALPEEGNTLAKKIECEETDVSTHGTEQVHSPRSDTGLASPTELPAASIPHASISQSSDRTTTPPGETMLAEPKMTSELSVAECTDDNRARSPSSIERTLAVSSPQDPEQTVPQTVRITSEQESQQPAIPSSPSTPAEPASRADNVSQLMTPSREPLPALAGLTTSPPRQRVDPKSVPEQGVQSRGGNEIEIRLSSPFKPVVRVSSGGYVNLVESSSTIEAMPESPVETKNSGGQTILASMGPSLREAVMQLVDSTGMPPKQALRLGAADLIELRARAVRAKHKQQLWRELAALNRGSTVAMITDHDEYREYEMYFESEQDAGEQLHASHVQVPSYRPSYESRPSSRAYALDAESPERLSRRPGILGTAQEIRSHQGAMLSPDKERSSSRGHMNSGTRPINRVLHLETTFNTSMSREFDRSEIDPDVRYDSPAFEREVISIRQTRSSAPSEPSLVLGRNDAIAVLFAEKSLQRRVFLEWKRRINIIRLGKSLVASRQAKLLTRTFHHWYTLAMKQRAYNDFVAERRNVKLTEAIQHWRTVVRGFIDKPLQLYKRFILRRWVRKYRKFTHLQNAYERIQAQRRKKVLQEVIDVWYGELIKLVENESTESSTDESERPKIDEADSQRDMVEAESVKKLDSSEASAVGSPGVDAREEITVVSKSGAQGSPATAETGSATVSDEAEDRYELQMVTMPQQKAPEADDRVSLDADQNTSANPQMNATDEAILALLAEEMRQGKSVWSYVAPVKQVFAKAEPLPISVSVAPTTISKSPGRHRFAPTSSAHSEAGTGANNSRDHSHSQFAFAHMHESQSTAQSSPASEWSPPQHPTPSPVEFMRTPSAEAPPFPWLNPSAQVSDQPFVAAASARRDMRASSSANSTRSKLKIIRAKQLAHTSSHRGVPTNASFVTVPTRPHSSHAHTYDRDPSATAHASEVARAAAHRVTAESNKATTYHHSQTSSTAPTSAPSYPPQHRNTEQSRPIEVLASDEYDDRALDEAIAQLELDTQRISQQLQK